MVAVAERGGLLSERLAAMLAVAAALSMIAE
jgi:hypothetical protein